MSLNKDNMPDPTQYLSSIKLIISISYECGISFAYLASTPNPRCKCMLKESCPGSREIKTPYPENITCFWYDTVSEIWSDEVVYPVRNAEE